MKKETFLNITIIVALITGLFVSLIYSYYLHRVNRMLVTKENQEVIRCKYQYTITDDSITVYDYNRFVGTIKLDGSLDSLMIEDNQ